MQHEIVFDIESNGFIFESTEIWTICAKNLQTGNRIKLNPFNDKSAKDKFLDFIFTSDTPKIIGHNILGFDMFVLMNIMGIDFTVGKDTICNKPVQFIDTFYLSMFLNPDREGHSIDYFGGQLGLAKIDWRQEAIDLGIIDASSEKGAEFLQHHPQMDVYCDRDIDVGEKVYLSLKEEYGDIYRKPFEITNAFRCGQKAFFLMSCQELTGWKFDIGAAESLKQRIMEMMEEIRSSVEPQLPARKLKKTEEKTYMMPAKPFKKDGSYSSSWNNFVAKHSGKELENGLWEFYGQAYAIESGKILDIKLPMEMANQDQMKDWFLEMGWVPSFYNFKRGPDGKPERDPKTRELIKTTPKIQDAGKICPNLLKMEADIVQKVVKWLSLRNRLSVLQGWLDNSRLQMDGRIGGGRTGIASSHRQKHKTIVNVPKASDKVLLGKEFRALWIAEENMLIAAGDAAALEGRVLGHYTWKYDDGLTANEILNGDPHSKNAFAFYGHLPELQEFDITSKDFNKEDPKFKPFRDKSKNGFYALLYGCSAPKLASTLGLPETMGKQKLDKFWDANPGTKALKDAIEKYWETAGRQKYLPAIDGRMLITRKKSALLNTIFQSCGGIVMDYACCFMDSWLGGLKWKDRKPYYLYKGHVVRRVAYVHDEMEFECDSAIAQEVSVMIEMAIKKAGEHLKLNVELAGEGKYGVSWKDVH